MVNVQWIATIWLWLMIAMLWIPPGWLMMRFLASREWGFLVRSGAYLARDGDIDIPLVSPMPYFNVRRVLAEWLAQFKLTSLQG